MMSVVKVISTDISTAIQLTHYIYIINIIYYILYYIELCQLSVEYNYVYNIFLTMTFTI